MPELRNAFAGPFGAVYDFCAERERLFAIVGRVVWGIDTRAMFASMSAIGDLGDGQVILDVPCGGGVAFRWLRPDQRVRYIAADLSETMLARARRRAAAHGLHQVELIAADICALPLEDASVDLCLSYSGLHCVARPDVAIAELGRCLRQGGALLGTTFVSAGSRRQRVLLGVGQRRGELGPIGTTGDLCAWLHRAGIGEITLEPSTGFVVFTGRKGTHPR